MTEFDLGALALALAFSYRGYRGGFIAVALGLSGGLIAFGLAAVLTPLIAPSLTPLLSRYVDLPDLLLRGLILTVLTFTLRFLLGYALRELATVLRMLVEGIPPLALLDRLLGSVAMAALGALLALALVLAALALPERYALHDAASRSWLARSVIAHPEQTIARIRAFTERLLHRSPAVERAALTAGVTGLAAAIFAGGRLREPGRASFREAATRRIARPALASADSSPSVVDGFRALCGVGVALGLAAGLVMLAAVR